MKLILNDGTIINNCSNSSNKYDITIIRNSYSEAAVEADKINENNTVAFTLKDDNDIIVAEGRNLKLSAIHIVIANDKPSAVVHFRDKTEIEIMQDEIAELQEAMIGG